MTSVRSASAARQGGDDFQHLVAWNRVLRALPEQRGLVAVEVEALGVGNVDDVVIRSSAQPDEFTQVRFGVDLAHPIDVAYLTKVKGHGTSLLTKFHRAWTELGGREGRAHLQLITNKVADPTDIMMREVDGRTSTLAPALRIALPTSRLGEAKDDLANHLGIEDRELLDLLDDLRFRLGCQHANEAEHASSLMLTSGLHHDASAVRVGIDLIRQWVMNGRRRLEAQEVRREIEAGNLLVGESWSTLLVQGIDHDPYADDADIALDFVALYGGDDPKVRRRVSDGGYADMHAQLRAAAAQLRGQGHHRVMVKGAMRLATWFTAGEALSEVAGYAVLCGHPNQAWASNPQATPVELDVRATPIDTGPNLVVALAFAADPTDDVEAFVRRSGLPASSIVTIGPPGGTRIADQADANGYATAIKQAVRQELRDRGAQEVHLFMAAPAGLALLLGHGWNRVAATTLWEDLGVAGYEPAFSLPG